MYPRYPGWEAPEIEDWRDYDPPDYQPRCSPLFAIGALGIVGALAFCRPRSGCRPRFGCFPFGCFPYRCYPYASCSPTYICYPRRA